MLFMLHINIYVIKIMSKFPSRHLVRLQRELTLTDTGKKSTSSYVVATKGEGKSKAVPLRGWSGPEGSRKLRLPDFMTMALDGTEVVRFTYRPPLPPGNDSGTHFC